MLELLLAANETMDYRRMHAEARARLFWLVGPPCPFPDVALHGCSLYVLSEVQTRWAPYSAFAVGLCCRGSACAKCRPMQGGPHSHSQAAVICRSMEALLCAF